MPLPRRYNHILCAYSTSAAASAASWFSGIDRNPASGADVLCDLDRFPYPFRDATFDKLQAIHVIEHVSDVIKTMEEFHRLLGPGGEAFIVTPHYTDFSSFCDPTHRWHLTSFSLRYFTEKGFGFDYYSRARFEELSVHVKLLALWRYLGFELAVNASPRFRRWGTLAVFTSSAAK